MGLHGVTPINGAFGSGYYYYYTLQHMSRWAAPRSALGALLKEAVGAPACSTALWGALGRYHAACGALESAKEAHLKQARRRQAGRQTLI
jgi:hypothetical protein